MNIFEAYNIIGELGGAVVRNNSGFISDSLYPFSKQETYDAYTLLIGHIVSFSTKTKEDFDKIYFGIGHVENIVPHTFYEQQREAEAIVEKAKSPLYRLFNKEKIELAKNLSYQFMSQCSSNWGHAVNNIQGFDYADLIHTIYDLLQREGPVTYDELVALIYSYTSQKKPTPLENRVFRSFKELALLSSDGFDYSSEPLGMELKSLVLKNKDFILYNHEQTLAMNSK